MLFKDHNLLELCLISHEGEIIKFLSKSDLPQGDKNRIAASILASVALGSRSVATLVNENLKQIILKGEKFAVYIKNMKSNVYIYVKTQPDMLKGLISLLDEIEKELGN